jgi:hypothetical protein
MSTIELKKVLISKISEIDDEVFLAAINTILDSKSKSIESYNEDLQKSENDIANGNVLSHNQVLEKIIILTEQQKKEIQNSRKEYLEGNYFDNDSVNEEMEKWLREE